ncbi:MAG: lysophospholipid acyltransferase family protein [Anaerolineales bacterium]|nr:lysophospholipid acyltransferase family protein [Anaerolineales bacterium]
MGSYRVAAWRRWLARPLARLLLGAAFHLLSEVRIFGREHVPHHSAYIVAFNHVSIYDPAVVGVFWPEPLEIMGAVEVWSKPGQGFLARLWGGIPVHRGEYDRALFETVTNVLRSGYPLLIAPEGTRSHAPGLQRAKPGIAYILEKTAVPVVPVGVVGTTDDFWDKARRGLRPRIEMHIGRPIRLSLDAKGAAERRAARQIIADLVMRHIAGLLPEEYRGVYADHPIFPE